jgi:hypothetical protein
VAIRLRTFLRDTPFASSALWLAVITLALGVLIQRDVLRLRAVSEISQQGSPPPALEAHSPTGYALGQRHFLGSHERGETYRWIAAAQQLVVGNGFGPAIYDADTAPTGRPQLLPRLYTSWVAVVAWGLHLFTGESPVAAVERAALWEPVIAHVVTFLAAVVFMVRRQGGAGAAVAAWFVAGFPPLTAQFLPGVLSSQLWALLFAVCALMLIDLPLRAETRKPVRPSVGSAIAAAIALWLDPAFGFPVVLLGATISVADLRKSPAPGILRWSVIGSATVLTAWLIDRTPWSPAAGELRYVHPLYAAAWLGLGLVIDGIRRRLTIVPRRSWSLVEIVVGVALIAALGWTQIHHTFAGWLYPGASLRRLTSLDETVVFNHALDWIAHGSVIEVLFVWTPVVIVAAWLAPSVLSRDAKGRLPSAIILLGLATLAFFRIRWGVVAAFVAFPILCVAALEKPGRWRNAVALSLAGFLAAIALRGRALPVSSPADATDLETLVYRHFSYWFASHHPAERTVIVAAPELSDSLVFHGGRQVLMSTAWESHEGQVAASRILSAQESSEAEAILQSRQITHIVLGSWDRSLPLLVQQPKSADKDTLYARLQRWVLPAYLRPIPYHLPSLPAFAGQKLAVFKVVPPQDEALSLSRLAEYFVEMNRPEPAALAAKVLAESYPDDADAGIARATVYLEAKNQPAFAHELGRLAADVSAGKPASSWDRRVRRAIVLALGHQLAIARAEIERCAETATTDDLRELTSLDAYQLRTLMKHFGASFTDPQLATVLASLGTEYSTAAAR